MKFSIITVCLNEADSICETCESICSQTCSDFEWIIIDGHSTDGTLDILAEYKSRISCLVSTPDAGIYNAMNKGIQRASGEYLLFLNAGDSLVDASVLQRVAQAPRKDVVFGDVVIKSEQGCETLAYPDRLEKLFLLKKMICHQAVFCKRELLLRHGAFDERFKITADYDLLVRLLYLHKSTYFHVSCPVSIYKANGMSSLKKYRLLRKKEGHEIRKKYFPWYRYGLRGLKEELRVRCVYCFSRNRNFSPFELETK